MSLIILSECNFISFPNNKTTYRIDDLILQTNKDVLKSFFDQHQVHYFGTHTLESIMKSPYFLGVGDESALYTTYNVSDLSGLATVLQDMIMGFSLFLWFIRDNSVIANEMLISDTKAKNGITLTKGKFYTNAKGVHEIVQFTDEELLKAQSIMVKAIKIKELKEVISVNPEGPVEVIYKYPSSYRIGNRIDRALMFLELARETGILPLKVSFHIAIYESLFTTDNSEVSHKVSERIAFYMGVDGATKKTIFLTVKSAYDIRSKFVHGQTISKEFATIEALIDISLKIDSLTRLLLLKVINDDSDKFLDNNENLTSWFNRMLFNTSPPV